VEIAAERGKADAPSLMMRAEEFARFAEARRERALRLAFRLLAGDEATAEDVVQNAFFRAHRALAGFRGEASLDTWFYRILVREVQRQRRWQALRRWFAVDPEVAPPALDPRPMGDPGLRRRIAKALERLSAGQREAFVLVHLEELTVTEAAEVLGKAVGTVKSHLHRALAALRLELADLREPTPIGDGSRDGEGHE
jgi:RNA polymerase sigma-70 factor (ECF subfamily)